MLGQFERGMIRFVGFVFVASAPLPYSVRDSAARAVDLPPATLRQVEPPATWKCQSRIQRLPLERHVACGSVRCWSVLSSGA